MKIFFDRTRVRFNFRGMDHSPGFLALVNAAKQRVNEISVAEARARLAANPNWHLTSASNDRD